MVVKYEVAVVGAGFSGLSAAKVLGRARRSTVVFDSKQQRNLSAKGAHSILLGEGRSPRDLYTEIKEGMRYLESVKFIESTITNVKKISDDKHGDFFFLLSDAVGHKYQVRRLVLATGLRDILPDIKGISQLWGQGVFHCVYCEGYEFTDKKIAVYETHGGEEGVYGSVLALQNWSKNITILSNNNPELLDPKEKQKLARLKIAIQSTPISSVSKAKDAAVQIVFADGSSECYDALFIRPKVEQKSDIARKLGCDFDDLNIIVVNAEQKTTVDGVFAVGDSAGSDLIAGAIHTGSIAAKRVNFEITDLNLVIEEVKMEEMKKRSTSVFFKAESRWQQCVVAIQQESLADLKKQLEMVEDVNHQEGGQTLMMHAINSGFVDGVKLLVGMGSDLSCVINGSTPLIMAAENDQLTIFKLLVEQYSCNPLERIKFRLPGDERPRYRAAVEVALENESYSVCDYLFLQSRRVDVNENLAGRSYLMLAILQDSPSLIDKVLSYGANPNSSDGTGYSPLTKVLALPSELVTNRVEIIEKLVAHGADVESVDSIGQKPIGVAESISDSEEKSVVLRALNRPTLAQLSK